MSTTVNSDRYQIVVECKGRAAKNRFVNKLISLGIPKDRILVETHQDQPVALSGRRPMRS